MGTSCTGLPLYFKPYTKKIKLELKLKLIYFIESIYHILSNQEAKPVEKIEL